MAVRTGRTQCRMESARRSLQPRRRGELTDPGSARGENAVTAGTMQLQMRARTCALEARPRAHNAPLPRLEGWLDIVTAQGFVAATS